MTTTPGTCRPCDDAPAEPTRDNPPGQPALAWRLGDHAAFLGRMALRLPRIEVPAPLGAPPGSPDLRPLAGLNTRAPDDPSIALLDAFAVAADVLAFYQERIANEGFLRTATERLSVLELARAVGYELKPGVAAGALLAFTIDESPGSPRRAVVATGTKVQSVPGQDELPQTFETVEPIEARVEHNRLRPRLTQPQRFAFAAGALKLVGLDGVTQVAANRIYLAGTATGLKPGDVLVVLDGALAAAAVTVYRVTTDQPSNTTAIDLLENLSPTSTSLPPVPVPAYPPPTSTGVIDATPRDLDLTYVQTEIVAKVWTEEGLAALIELQRWSEDELLKLVGAVVAAQGNYSEAHALRQRLAFFGAGAPAYKATVPPTPSVSAILGVLNGYSSSTFASKRDEIAAKVSLAAQPYVTGASSADWDANGGRSIWTSSGGTPYSTTEVVDCFLERSVPDVVKGSWVVVRRSGKDTVFSVVNTVEQSRIDYATTAKVTGLRLGNLGKTPITTAEKDTAYKVRATQALVQSEKLALAPLPIVDVLEEVATESGATVRRGARAIVLDRMVLGLEPGRTVVVAGTVAPPAGSSAASTAVVRSEAVTLSAVIHRAGFTTLYFATNLADRYLRATVTVAANVARATHGETVPREVLGSGQASAANQRFILRRPPLTFVSAPTPTGTESTLTVRVDDVAWEEVPSLYGVEPDRPAYTLRTGDDGITTVIFGDGVAGSRLPTGTENVVATYRAGLGVAGEVGADRLTLLQSRPLGVRSVTNPVAASGGEDRESLDDARANAPLAVLTLGRVVSLRDYEDFTRAFAGISKAQAAPVWNGHQTVMHVTVASASGGAIDPLSDLYRNLVDGIAAASDGTRAIEIDSFQPLLFKIDAELHVDPRRDLAGVQAEAVAALGAAFAFDTRSLGQRVTEAEVLTVLQAVDGVVGARLAKLAYVTEQGAEGSAAVGGILAARGARWQSGSGSGDVLPAELLTLHPAGASVTAAVAP